MISSWCVADGTVTATVVSMKNITPALDHLPAAPAKPKRISAKVRAAIDALVAGDVTTVADGWPQPRAPVRELSKPHIG
jgi:hypothetical protein